MIGQSIMGCQIFSKIVGNFSCTGWIQMGVRVVTINVKIILISQLLTAGIIDAFALFDSEKIRFAAHNYLGIILMIIGMISFSSQ